MPTAYYNEIDPFCVAWLRNLMDARLIMRGVIDNRSIADVKADDLVGFTRVHFFAGIAGWDYALQLAGWPEDRPVWTGSCPCQPFSVAGKGRGTEDERHLWPVMHRLIEECHPATVFGEQVASAAGRDWLAGVRTDLEALAYAVGCADLCAAGVAAPHLRQRLYWVADSDSERRDGQPVCLQPGRPHEACLKAGRGSADCGLVDRFGAGLEGHAGHGRQGDELGRDDPGAAGPASASGGTDHWRPSVAIQCRDAWRRVPADQEGTLKPSIFPLADGVPNRVGILRGAGNAIVPQVAATFIEAFMECRP